MAGDGPQDTEGHGHAVVGIALDLGRNQGAGGDAQPVVAVLDVLAQAAQFVDGGDEPVRLFDADVGDVADGRGAVAQGGDGGQGHDRVADVVHVDVDAAQRARAADRGGVGAALDGGAHLLQHGQEAVVALQAGRRQVGHGDAVAAGGRQGGGVGRG